MKLFRYIFFVLLLAAFVGMFNVAVHAQTPGAPTSETIAKGATIQFLADAQGSEPITFEWFRNGVLITAADGKNLTIQSLNEDTAGSYTVKATNAYGSAVSPPYIISIGQPPTNPAIKIVVTLAVTVSPPSK